MKIAVSSMSTSLDGQVDPRFGRCPIILVVDTETLAVEALSNTSVEAAHGAGIGAAQMIASKGVKALLTGSVGPNAYSALTAAGIKVCTGVSGTVRDAVDKYKRGDLPQTSEPTVGGHHGMGEGGGRGGGQGRGRGV
jgi:predicted Fe-Mo cluster-binding NifX family protein